jgi:hypothetical protein
MSVIKFPLIGNYEQEIYDYQEKLDGVYTSLDELHQTLNKLEAEAYELEGKYNRVLSKYAKAVGNENIPVGFLEYSTLARVTFTDEGVEILFEALEDE